MTTKTCQHPYGARSSETVEQVATDASTTAGFTRLHITVVTCTLCSVVVERRLA